MAVKHQLQAPGGVTPEQQTQLQGNLPATGNFGPGYGKRGGGRGMGMAPAAARDGKLIPSSFTTTF